MPLKQGFQLASFTVKGKFHNDTKGEGQCFVKKHRHDRQFGWRDFESPANGTIIEFHFVYWIR